MRRFLLSFAIFAVASAAVAQTMNLRIGQVTYAYPADNTGDVTVSDAGITIGQKTFPISEITNITVDNTVVDAGTVNVVYGGATANVVIAGDIAHLVTAKVSGAHVTLLQSSDTSNEIKYTLSGATTDGSLYMDGSLKATFVLNGVNIHNPDSAAINIQDGKRIAVILPEGTESTLSDGIKGANDGSDAHNACFYVNGHTEFNGAGTLTITGNVKHAFTSDEYCLLKSNAGTIIVPSAVGDGFHIGQYYRQKGGTVNIKANSDGVDVGLKKDKTKDKNGQILLEGGMLTASVSGVTSDAMKCDSLFTMSGGKFELLTTGTGGRVINCNGNVEISGGELRGASCGDVFDPGLATERKPHGIKSDGSIILSGGTVCIAASAKKGTSFKADLNFAINGGTLMGIGGKKSTASAVSTQPSKQYLSVQVPAGGTVSFDGVSFTVPTEYSNPFAYVIVSRPGL
jgi:hypothetical protein